MIGKFPKEIRRKKTEKEKGKKKNHISCDLVVSQARVKKLRNRVL